MKYSENVHLRPPEGVLWLNKPGGTTVLGFDDFRCHDKVAIALVNSYQVCHLDNALLDT